MIRYFASVGPTLLAPALARVRRKHQGIRMDLKLFDPQDPLPAGETGQRRPDLPGAFQRRKLQSAFVAKSEDYATAQGFVAAGLGVGLIPRLCLGTRHPTVVIRNVRVKPPSIRGPAFDMLQA